MQSRIKMGKKQTNRVCDDVWKTILKAMCDNLSVTCIVLNQQFGFGKERIRKFIAESVKMNHKVSEWQDEEVADEMIRRLLEGIGLAYEEIYLEDKQDFKDFMHENKKRKEYKNKIGFADAMRIQSKMHAMKEFLK